MTTKNSKTKKYNTPIKSLKNRTSIGSLAPEQSKTPDTLESDITDVNFAVSLHRNTITVEINGRKTNALVDTGASISCIKKVISR